MEDAATVSLAEAGRLVRSPGIHLVLGYHPRANLPLAKNLSSWASSGGIRSLLIDCDHTLVPDRGSSGQVLLSRPEEVDDLARDLRAARRLKGELVIILNRPSSLIAEAHLLERFEAKKRMWLALGEVLVELSRRGAVLVLEDSRRYDEVEYKVHPAIYYLCGLLLDAVEEGKEVLQYRMLKKRPEKP